MNSEMSRPRHLGQRDRWAAPLAPDAQELLARNHHHVACDGQRLHPRQTFRQHARSLTLALLSRRTTRGHSTAQDATHRMSVTLAPPARAACSRGHGVIVERNARGTGPIHKPWMLTTNFSE
jgi:hypothetical protein